MLKNLLRTTIFSTNYYKEILLLANFNIKSLFAGNRAGRSWVFIKPFVLVLIYYFLSKNLIQDETIENHFLFILTNIVIWNVVSRSITVAPLLLRSYKFVLFNKSISKHKLVSSNVIQNSVFFVICSLVILPVYFFTFRTSTNLEAFLLLPVFIVCFAYFLFLMCFILSLVYPYFKDMTQIIEMSMPFLMWMTPILYSKERLGSGLLFIFQYINPFYIVINPITQILAFNSIPTIDSVFSLFILLAIMTKLLFILNKITSKTWIYYL